MKVSLEPFKIDSFLKNGMKNGTIQVYEGCRLLHKYLYFVLEQSNNKDKKLVSYSEYMNK